MGLRARDPTHLWLRPGRSIILEIKQKKASQAGEDRPPPRARRESDAMPGPAKKEYRHAYFPASEDRYGQCAPSLTEGPEGLTEYDHPNKSPQSVDRSPTFERSEDNWPSTRAGERPTRAGTKRYAPSSAMKYEIWKPNITAAQSLNAASPNANVSFSK